MKFVPVNVEELNSRNYKESKWMAYLDEFVRSTATEVEVVDDLCEYNGATSLRSSVNSAVKRFGYNIQCMTRKGRVILAKPGSVLYCEQPKGLVDPVSHLYMEGSGKSIF